LAKKLANYEKDYLEFQARLALGRQAQNQQLLRQCLDGVKKPGYDIPKTCLARWKRLRETGALDPDGNVRFTLVAHSMGGLVARYFVDGLGYKGRINKLILVGSPNLGTMGALRAIVDGEFPESLTSTFGLHLFLKEDTLKVYLSFGSIFQLLPRYPEAVTDRDGEDLGERIGLGKKMATSEAIGEWERLFIPTADQLSPYFPDLDGYLLFQLESARCFHAAISGRFLRYPDEEDRIDQIIHYLEGVEHVPLDLPLKGHPLEPPVMLFGSYCYDTLTEALIDGNEVRFRDGNVWSSDQAILAGGDTSGDGRVPVKSLDYSGDERFEDTRFFLCEGHMAIIKDRAFQYNLLRAVLRTSSRS
jgi:pimeloyl-ACP methyl ester carboxylesterase